MTDERLAEIKAFIESVQNTTNNIYCLECGCLIDLCACNDEGPEAA